MLTFIHNTFKVLKNLPALKISRHLKNPYVYISIFILLFFITCGFLRLNKRVSVIKIGVLHSLTGTMSTSEAPLVDAIRLAVEEINAKSDEDDNKVEMIVADCRSDSDFCAEEARRLITEEKIDTLFGCWTSSCRKAVKTVVEKYDKLLFYPVQYEGLEKSSNIVYTGATPNQQIIPMAFWAFENIGKRFYFVGSDYIFPRVANYILKDLMQIKGGYMLGERYFPLGTNDFTPAINDILRLNPDFIINTLNGESNLFFFQALDKAGIKAQKIPVFSTSIAEAELVFLKVNDKNLAAGHYAAWNYFQSLDTPENKSFVRQFQDRFGKDRVIDDPMQASYLGVKLWHGIIREQRSTDMTLFKTNLAHQTMLTPQGIVSMDLSTQHLWKNAYLGRARNDGQFDIVWQSLKPIRPSPFPLYHNHEEWLKILDKLAGVRP